MITRQNSRRFDLWQRCCGQLLLTNIAEMLLLYSISSCSMTHKHSQGLAQKVRQIFSRQLTQLRVAVNDATLEFHRIIGNEIPLEHPYQLKNGGWWEKSSAGPRCFQRTGDHDEAIYSGSILP